MRYGNVLASLGIAGVVVVACCVTGSAWPLCGLLAVFLVSRWEY
jgi:hypothetical protein